jgi:diadenosine tetraphosphate (Ap4A) HIT family hydrolase
MSKWSNPAEWTRLLSEEGCPICTHDRPFHVIAELEVSWLTMGEEPAVLPGTCALFFRRHAIELHDLSGDEAAAYVRDIQRVSKALQGAPHAVKINYEIHGNTIPHLHTHFYPRYPGDPFEGKPIDPRLPAAAFARRPIEHAEIRRRVMDVLDGSRP